MMIQWTEQNKNKLEELWLAGKSDAEISLEFGAGTYAIAKERSILGFIDKKQPKGIKRAKRTISETNYKPFYAIYYRKDNMNHFSLMENENPESVNEIARKLICSLNVPEVTILQPVTKLVMTKITEIKL